MLGTLRLSVDLSAQRLTVWNGERATRQYPVSTAANGPGEIEGSGATPRGRHRVRAKIGAGAAAGTVFRGRRVARDTPLCTAEVLARFPNRDWITSRILWLSGLEPGRNRLGCVDSMRRYIYIHGTPFLAELGRPASHGCIRMSDADVIELFDLVPAGTQVDLHE